MNTDQEWDDGFSGLSRKIKVAFTDDVASMPLIIGGEYASDLNFNSGKDWAILYAMDGSVQYSENQSLTGNGTLYNTSLSAIIRKETTAKTEELDIYLRKPLIIAYENKEGYFKIIGTIDEPVYLTGYGIAQGAPTENHYTISITSILAARPRIVTP